MVIFVVALQVVKCRAVVVVLGQWAEKQLRVDRARI